MEAQKLADFALDRNFDVSFSIYDRVLEALYTEETPCFARSRTKEVLSRKVAIL